MPPEAGLAQVAPYSDAVAGLAESPLVAPSDRLLSQPEIPLLSCSAEIRALPPAIPPAIYRAVQQYRAPDHPASSKTLFAPVYRRSHPVRAPAPSPHRHEKIHNPTAAATQEDPSGVG